MDFMNGGGHLKGAGSAAAGVAESEDDDDDLSDTRPSKRKAPGTRSRPARTTTPTVRKFEPLLHPIAPVPYAKCGLLDGQSSRIPQCQPSNNGIISRVPPALLWILNERTYGHAARPPTFRRPPNRLPSRKHNPPPGVQLLQPRLPAYLPLQPPPERPQT